MGEPKTPHFYDFGIWGRAQTPQNQLFSLETPGDLKINQEDPGVVSICQFQSLPSNLERPVVNNVITPSPKRVQHRKGESNGLC